MTERVCWLMANLMLHDTVEQGAVLTLNRPITTEEAVAWRLASRIVSAAEIQQKAVQLAQKIASMKPGSIRHNKRLLNPNQQKIRALLNTELPPFLQHIVAGEGIGSPCDYVNKSRAKQEST